MPHHRWILAGLLLIPVFLSGCSMVASPGAGGARPAPRGSSQEPSGALVASLPDGPRGPGAEGGETALAVVEVALEAIGTPYAWGGTDQNGFDCSGLVQHAFGEFGIDLPRVSRDQLRRGDPVDPVMEALLPGDVLGFSDVVGGEPTHVGLYVGNGDFIHSGSQGVGISNLQEHYWRRHIVAARRMVR